MADAPTHEPGSFCWADLATSDVQGVLAFYTGLFGWTSDAREMDGGSDYHLLKGEDGADVGAVFGSSPGSARGAGWLSYVAVANAAETAAKVEGFGGTVVTEAVDVSDAGRAAVISGPGGEALALWEARTHPGAGIWNRPGAMAWNELVTHDAESCRVFYTNLFGWDTDQHQRPGYRYTTFMRARFPVAGMMEMSGETGDRAAHWMVYFGVQDCAAATAKAVSLGGKVEVPCTEIAEVGTFAVLSDPGGAAFSVLKRAGW